ncbi:sodium:proton exchanger [Candidatus Peregrinibacteria bacterium CG10_big_fil_rev_8_21_14_0_10_49_24]|nr:MAG: sodium:proton exchanger [Candidatus Peregrinibacteria bacterium CG11_big_fil_rev_8_21_14_0_20_49_14]PIR51118.1 MAG: sodium:proton exchanger [Candidatus Peregrinibacteria bacterium CG10_big_fil_rev_8_21_14_0_10_49_24]
MPILFILLLFAVGVALLIKGADWLVEGASSLARRLHVSDLVIGLTVVAFGTSAPELLVNIVASIQGSSDIAIGNIVGSNISNTLLILGITAIITPLAIQKSTVLKEIPFSLLAAGTLFIMANDSLVDGYLISELGRGDGIVFLGFFAIFMYYTFGIRNNGFSEDGHTKADMSVWKAIWLIFIGLIGLSAGGNLAVQTAQDMALTLGISESLVGLTAVAVGTSLPELTASVMAALKGKPDMSVGNIVGSNIFNIFWILGISAIIKPLPFRQEMNVDLLMIVFSATLLFFIVHNGGWHRRLFLWWRQNKDYILTRWEGGVLVTSYIAYIIFVTWRG